MLNDWTPLTRFQTWTSKDVQKIGDWTFSVFVFHIWQMWLGIVLERKRHSHQQGHTVSGTFCGVQVDHAEGRAWPSFRCGKQCLCLESLKVVKCCESPEISLLRSHEGSLWHYLVILPEGWQEKFRKQSLFQRLSESSFRLDVQFEEDWSVLTSVSSVKGFGERFSSDLWSQPLNTASDWSSDAQTVKIWR